MALLDDQAKMYLKLQGHLPEMFLLTELFGRSEAEAQKIMAWREVEALSYHPAVMAIRIVAERARLRKELNLPPVEDEEATVFEEGTRIQTLRGKATIDQEGKIDLGDAGIPAGLADTVKRHLLESLMQDNSGGGFGVARFESKDGPGSVTFPDGREVEFDSPQAFFDAVKNGELDFRGEGGEGDGESD